MKFISTILAIFLTSYYGFSQQPAFEWSKNVGGSSTDVGTDVATDEFGNVYVCGRFMSSADADPGSETQTITSNGDFDMCVVKLDVDGNFLWVKTLGGTGFDQFTDVEVDHNNNCILLGSFSSTINPDPNAETTTFTATGEAETLLLKLDGDGNTLWYRRTEGNDYCYPSGLGCDSNNEIYFTGSFQGTCNFDPFIVNEDVSDEESFSAMGTSSAFTSNGFNDVFVCRISSDGSFNWVKRVGSTSYDASEGLCVDHSNRINIVGRFRETVDFDPNGLEEFSTSAGLNDPFILRLTTDGEYSWHSTFGSTNYDEIWSVAVDPSDNILTFGYFSGSVDLDPGEAIQSFTSNGSDDLFIQKFSSSGELSWVKTFGGSELENSYSVTCDSEGNVLLIGDFFNTVDFNPGTDVSNLTSAGNNDIYYLKLNGDGEYEWALRIGATFSQAGYAITTDSNDNIISTGTFSNAVDFDPGAASSMMSAQDFNIFILKLSATCSLPELTAVTASDSEICEGETITLTIDGTLNDATTWQVRTESCNGTVLTSASGSSVDITPEAGVDYFIRGAGGCVVQEICLPIDLTVNTVSETSENLTHCLGESVTFPDGTTIVLTDDISHTSVLTSSTGCDSIINTFVNIPYLPDDLEIQLNGDVLELLNFPSKSSVDIQWVDCNNNFEPIENETSTTYQFTTSGSFAVMTSNNGCTDITDCFLIIGVSEIDNSEFHLFPNPSEGEFRIQSSKDNFVNVEIFTTDGKLIHSIARHPVSSSITIPSEAAPGMYFVKVVGSTHSRKLKLIMK